MRDRDETSEREKLPLNLSFRGSNFSVTQSERVTNGRIREREDV